MGKFLKYFLFTLIVFIFQQENIIHENSNNQTVRTTASSNSPRPIDHQATKETTYLFHQMRILAGQKLLFGHQNSEREGFGWSMVGTPDVYKVVGKYPAVTGFDFREVADYPSSFKSFYLQKVKDVYQRGGIITFSWHMKNVANGESFYNRNPSIHQILPGGSHARNYQQELDKFVHFAKQAISNDGRPIPIIFRMFHENTDRWFWWGNSIHSCPFAIFPTTRARCRRLEHQEYVNLWRYTVNYFFEKGVHNLLYSYSPGCFDSRREYLWKYPGDDYVDILGTDCYEDSVEDFIDSVSILVKMASKKKKISAITETGSKGLDNPSYWTEDFLNPIKNNYIARNISYALVWRNSSHDADNIFVPYPGQESVKNFKEMEKDPFILFEQDLPNMYSNQN